MTETPAAPGPADDGEPNERTVAADRAEISAPAAQDSNRPGEPAQMDADDGAAAAAAAPHMLTVDARKVVAVGTALFLLAFLVLLPMYGWLGHHGHRVWLWTALAGWVLGAASFPLIGKHSSEGRLG